MGEKCYIKFEENKTQRDWNKYPQRGMSVIEVKI